MLINPYRFGGGASSGGGGGDPHYSDVALLLHIDSVSGGNFPDSSSNPAAQGANVGGTLDTSNKKFGAASVILGTPPSTLSGLIDTNIGTGAFDISTSDFTIETWIYITNPGTAVTWAVSVPFSPFIVVLGSSPYTIFSASGTVALPAKNQWVHVALVMQSDAFVFYYDGVHQNSPVSVTGRSAGALHEIDFGGSQFGPAWFGNFDEIRITKFARYTADFSPPTAPFPDF
jgi:hypothetical protein